MKKIFSSLLLVAALLSATTLMVEAASITTYCGAQTTNGVNILSQPAAIFKITLANTNNTGPNQVALFNTANTNVYLALSAYTNVTLMATNQIVNFTNIVGSTENTTNSVYFWSNAVVSAAYTLNAILHSAPLTAGTNTYVYSPTYPIIAPSGVTITNLYGLSITLDYAPLK